MSEPLARVSALSAQLPDLSPQLPVFICYRQFDGLPYARWIYEALTGSFKACGDDTLVYFDQVAPANSDWTAIHRPALERACCLVVIITPGLYAELANDWVHKEIDWWLKHRKAAPILIDTTGGGERWIPQKIKSRWPSAQRVEFDPGLWEQANHEEREQIRAQVGEQIIGAVKGSRSEVVAQDLARARRLKRAAAVFAIAVVTAGLVYLGYTQTAYYQIDAMIKSAPVRDVAEHYATTGSGCAVWDYLRALAAYKPDKAVSAALEISGLDSRSAGLMAVAEGQLDAGRKAETAETLLLAVRIARNIDTKKTFDPFYKVRIFASIAEEQARAGQIAEADKTWEQAVPTDIELKAGAFAEIAWSQAKAGRFSEAYRTAQRIEDPGSKSSVIVGVAKWQAQTGHYPEAIETLAQAYRAAQGITDSESWAGTLDEIAVGQANAREFAEAHRTARQITPGQERVRALVGIAEQEAQAGRNDEVERTVREIAEQDPKEEGNVLRLVAGMQADAGEFAAAHDTAAKIAEPEAKIEALLWIAKVEAESGRIGEARRTANEIPDPNAQKVTLASIAEGYARADRIAEAQTTLEKVVPRLQDEPRLWIAEAQARVRHWKAARNTAGLCTANARLRAYAAILNQYVQSKGHNSKTGLRQPEKDYLDIDECAIPTAP